MCVCIYIYIYVCIAERAGFWAVCADTHGLVRFAHRYACAYAYVQCSMDTCNSGSNPKPPTHTELASQFGSPKSKT